MRAKSIFLALVSSSTSVIGLRVIFRRFLWSGKVDKGQLPSKITTCITSQSTFRDLGVLIDSQLTIEVHVRNVVHSCFYQLRQLRSIRRDHYQQVPGEPGCCIHRQSSWLLQRTSFCTASLHKSSVVFRWFWTMLPVWRRLFATCFIGSQCHSKYSLK